MSLKKCIEEFIDMKSTLDSEERRIIMDFLCSVYMLEYRQLEDKINRAIIKRMERSRGTHSSV